MNKAEFEEKCAERNNELKLKLKSVVTNLDECTKVATAKLFEKCSPKKRRKAAGIMTAENFQQLVMQFCEFMSVMQDKMQNLTLAVLESDSTFWSDLVLFCAIDLNQENY